MTMRLRSLRRWERGLAYGVVGMATEVVVTGARDGVVRRDWGLRGRSYVWMVPIHGLSAYLFEPVGVAGGSDAIGLLAVGRLRDWRSSACMTRWLV
jgi:hypothetical protein